MEAAAGLPRLPDDVWIPAWRDIFFRDERALGAAPAPRAGRDAGPRVEHERAPLGRRPLGRPRAPRPPVAARALVRDRRRQARPGALLRAALALAGAAPRDASSRTTAPRWSRQRGRSGSTRSSSRARRRWRRISHATRPSRRVERAIRGYSLKVKRVRLSSLCGLIACRRVAGCRGRDEALRRPWTSPLDHSKKSPSSGPSRSFASGLRRGARERPRREEARLRRRLHGLVQLVHEDGRGRLRRRTRARRRSSSFVPIKVDTDKGGGRAVANRYRVEGLPAYPLRRRRRKRRRALRRLRRRVETFLSILVRASGEPELTPEPPPISRSSRRASKSSAPGASSRRTRSGRRSG